jgi:hypothetical protein
MRHTCVKSIIICDYVQAGAIKELLSVIKLYAHHSKQT